MTKPKLAVKKFNNTKELRDDTKRASMGGGLQSVPKEGCTIRFLTEPNEWLGFQEYYDEDARTFVPMVEGDTLPNGARPSMRYVANVLWQSEGAMQKKVVSFKMPKKVAIALLNKCDKYGTMTDRDYEIARYGEGTNTEYDVTPEAPSKVAIAKYDLLDLEEKLIEEYERAMGRLSDANTDDDEDDEDEKPKRNAKAKSAPAKKSTRAAADDDDDDEEDDEDGEVSITDVAALADDGDEDAMASLTELAEEAGLDPDEYGTWAELADALAEAEGDEEEEADDEAEEEDDEEEAIDVDELKGLAKKADKGNDEAMESLTAVAEACDIDPDKYATWAELVSAIVDFLSADDEEEEAEEEEGEEDEDGDEDEAEIDLDTLNGMSLAQLREFAEEYDIEHKGLTKKALIQAIVDAAEE